jgi:sulfate adenylyltransferase
MLSMSEQLPAELASWPAWTPDEAQLGELELLTSGTFAPLTGYLSRADLASVSERGELADGTPWTLPVTLIVPAGIVSANAGPDGNHLVLTDPEGSPLAVVEISERWEVPATPSGGSGGRTEHPPGSTALAGRVTALRAPEHGPFRALRRVPADVRASLSGGPVIALATRGPLTQRHIGQLRHLSGLLSSGGGHSGGGHGVSPRGMPDAATSRGANGVPPLPPEDPTVSGLRVRAAGNPQAPRLLLLPLVAGPARVAGQPEALVRAVLAAVRQLPGGTAVVPVPLPPRADPAEELRAVATVARAYGATHLLTEGGPRAVGEPAWAGEMKIVTLGEWAYDPRAEVWRPLALIEPGAEHGELSDDELGALLDAGDPVPGWLLAPDVAAELRRARPARRERGLVVFFTGLSGSGKSTLARDLRDALLEREDRTVSLLDGDLVRRLLSAGLTFSRADRDLNIARIGFVATEVARHGGIAICAPIAPYAAARAAVRSMVTEVGDFVLIHVATPLAVCEARDRKGLYAKARAGLITGFTGIDDPYEEPTDASLTLDTSALSRREAVAAVLALLTREGWLASRQLPAASQHSRLA